MTTETKSKTRATWWRSLEAIGACDDAVAWCKTQPSLKAARAACERGDWMVWLIARTRGGIGTKLHRAVVLLACASARGALKHVRDGETRPLAAIEITERWARGEEGATIEMVRAARADAYRARSEAWGRYHAAYGAYLRSPTAAW